MYVELWDWIRIGGIEVSMGLEYDTVTIVMLTLVTTVSILVHIYSTEYMESDRHKIRFMSYLSMFTFFMLVLVTGDNLVQLFIG